MAIPSLVVTAPEVARVIRRLEPRLALSEHQIRYLAALRCVMPSINQPATFGDSALYAPEDVALIRLVLRLVAEGAPYWMARAAVAQCAGQLRKAFKAGQDGAFVVTGPVGKLASGVIQAAARTWSVRLADVRRGLLAAIREQRQENPDVWRWRSVPASTAATMVQREATA